MARTILFFSLLISASAFSQTSTVVSVIDFVKVKNNKLVEALFFYENNWKVYREAALKNNYITSYKLLQTPADSVADFDIMLVTEYADSSQLKLAEGRFQKIIKETSPGGPKLMNDLKPNDFRQNMFVKRTRTLFSSGR